MRRRHNKNWKLAREHFGISDQPEIVLHHTDPTLKASDPDRYYEWRTEDLVAIPKGEHSRIHHTGKVVSKETRSKISENHVGFLGKHHSEETKKKISEVHKGKTVSKETRQKISENHPRLRGANHPSSQKVLCVELNKVFYSIREASSELGISASGITRCCNGVKHYNTAGGYHWRHA